MTFRQRNCPDYVILKFNMLWDYFTATVLKIVRLKVSFKTDYSITLVSS